MPLYYHKKRSYLLFTKVIALICYWTQKLSVTKGHILWQRGPPPVTTVIRSQATFHEFIEKLYQQTGYEKPVDNLLIPGYEGAYKVADKL